VSEIFLPNIIKKSANLYSSCDQ